jgi:arylsulfatase A-like enzyme
VRADHLTPYGYERDTTPNLAAFADDAVVFTRAFTTVPLTVPAYASLLTGLYPHQHGVRTKGQSFPESSPLTISEVLAANGYDTAGVVSSALMLNRLSGLGRGFRTWEEQFSGSGSGPAFERSARPTVEAALAVIDRLTQPAFFFLHLVDPHGPYLPPVIHRKHYVIRKGTYLDGIHVPEYQRIQGARVVGDYIDAYDAEIRYSDAELGRLLNHLRATGQYDRALVIFTSNHGESFGEDGVYFEHDGTLNESTTRIPLLIKPPGGRTASTPARWDGAVSLVDLMPTILDYANVEKPTALAGISLRAVLEGAGRAEPRNVLSQLWTPRGGHWGVHAAEGTLYVADCDAQRGITSECPDTYLARRADGNVLALETTTPTRVILRKALEELVASVRSYRLPHAVPTRNASDSAPSELPPGAEAHRYDDQDVAILRKLGYFDRQ